MDTQSIITYKSSFDAIMHEIIADDGSTMEVWYARELQQVCGYARWENFQVAINRAKDSCNSQDISIEDHFRDVTKMVSLGSGSEREIKDILLTRYACYLIAQNGDPKKEEIAFAQSYFAVQTRRIINNNGTHSEQSHRPINARGTWYKTGIASACRRH